MEKLKITIRLYPLYIAILLLSVFILYQTGANPLFPIQYYVYGSGYDRIVSAGQQVNINASGTSSSNVGQIDFKWSQASGLPVLPNGTSKGPVLSFKAPVSGEPQILEFKLVASKGPVTQSENVSVLVKGDMVPNANAGKNVIVKALEICGDNTNSTSSYPPLPPLQPPSQVNLNGINSSDREGPLEFEWTQIDGSNVTISDPNNKTATIDKDSICRLTEGTYLQFRLNVTDSVGQSAFDTVTIAVIPGEDLISIS